MQRLTPKDIWPRPIYEAARSELRAKVIALKAHRRVHLTDEVTLVFENRETLRFQVQEILRAEAVDSPEAIQAELDLYNQMMPSAQHLQATLYIEVTDPDRVVPVLNKLVGLEEKLSLRFAGRTVKATFEAGRTDGQRISAVQYVQFPFPDAASRAAFLDASRVELVVEHPAAQAVVTLNAETLKSLQGDLLAE